MITQTAFGKETEIQDLLNRSLIQNKPMRTEAWIRQEFDPSQAFCFFQDDTLTSFLQSKRRSFRFLGQNFQTSQIVLAATLPDYRQRNHFGQLLDAFIEKASHNDLFSCVYTTFPKLFEARSFQTVSYSLQYWIPSREIQQDSIYRVKVYSGNKDLYPLYRSFMDCFDGSLIASRQEFQKKLQLALGQRKQILYALNEKQEIKGYLIFEPCGSYAKAEVLQYMDTQAILDLLSYLSLRFQDIALTVSQDERFEKLFPSLSPRKQGHFMVRLNHYKLFSKCVDHDIRNAKQAFGLIEAPSWNHFL